MEDFEALFKKFQKIRVGIIGDVMLDTYMWGSVERISPEAPVPIVSLQKKEQRIGGAGNVALNLQSLGSKAYVISITGDDEDAQKLSASFVVVLFYILTIAGIFILRKKRPDADRPYKAFGYPVLPVIYILLGLAFCILLIIYKPQFTWPGLIVVLIGTPLYYNLPV